MRTAIYIGVFPTREQNILKVETIAVCGGPLEYRWPLTIHPLHLLSKVQNNKILELKNTCIYLMNK